MLNRLIHIVLWSTLAAFIMSPLQAAQIGDLVAERAEQEFGPEMPPAGAFTVRLAEGLPDSGEFIQEFWIDKKTGQFIANVVTEYGEIQRVWGMAVLTVPIPVVNRRIQPDEIVKPQDVQLIEMPWARVHAFAITEAEDLTGMQVKRMLSPGRPVHHQSVTPPVIVSRGEKVTIQLRHGGMQLSAKGKAISDAYLGQEVRVINLASNKTITAVARGDGLVEALF